MHISFPSHTIFQLIWRGKIEMAILYYRTHDLEKWHIEPSISSNTCYSLLIAQRCVTFLLQ